MGTGHPDWLRNRHLRFCEAEGTRKGDPEHWRWTQTKLNLCEAGLPRGSHVSGCADIVSVFQAVATLAGSNV